MEVLELLGQLTSTQSSRAGIFAERVVKAVRAGVAPEVIALQINLNNRKNNPKNPIEFTGDDVKVISKLYDANKRTYALSKKQLAAMIREQKEADSAKDFCEEGFCPA